MSFKIYNQDCIECLDKLDVDNRKTAIITSPPYNMNLRIMNGKYCSRCSNKNHIYEFSTKYENYTDDLSMDEYFNFQKTFIEKALSITDIMFYNIQMITGNKIALFKLLGYFSDKIKEIIIWDKINSQPAMAQRMLNSQFEFIIVFDNNKPFNRQFDYSTFERGKLSNVWQIKRERNNKIKAGFPKELIRKIITNFIPQDYLIIDPFMGSGTTGIVCNELNYNFIGIEIDKNMFNIAQEGLLNVL